MEQAVLGTMMLEQCAVVHALDILDPDCFYNTKHSRIFEAMISLFVRDVAIDQSTLAEELKRLSWLDEVGGASYLAELSAKGGSPRRFRLSLFCTLPWHSRRPSHGFGPLQPSAVLVRTARTPRSRAPRPADLDPRRRTRPQRHRRCEDPRRQSQALSNLENCRARISADMAIRLAKAFGSTTETWIRLQAAYDVAQAQAREDEIEVKRYEPQPVEISDPAEENESYVHNKRRCSNVCMSRRPSATKST